MHLIHYVEEILAADACIQTRALDCSFLSYSKASRYWSECRSDPTVAAAIFIPDGCNFTTREFGEREVVATLRRIAKVTT